MKYLSRIVFLATLAIGSFGISVANTHAQVSQVLSVTPPLFQLSALPGDVWQSSIKVVNGNPYPMTVYAEVVNFKASGEEGQGTFIPIIAGDTEERTLAQWIEIMPGPYTIPPEKTKDISFFVDIPKDAPPGGHYAAILITTRSSDGGQMAVTTSQAVTTLLFARIEGDVHEVGSIREFRVLDGFVPKPEAEFSLRFENKGNVHLQPRGDILITNMWGTARGTIPINYQTHFGNVLPQSIRDFKFTWQSDLTFTDVGRYKAIVTLGYGEDGVKSVTSTTYFWVVPVKITLITLLVIASFIWLVVWMVRAYVRRMLALAGVSINSRESSAEEKQSDIITEFRKPAKETSYKKVSAPIRSGVIDLRTQLNAVEESVDVAKTVAGFVLQYRKFFISILVLIFIFVTAVLYIGRATAPNENYRVIIDEGDRETTLQGGDIKRNETGN